MKQGNSSKYSFSRDEAQSRIITLKEKAEKEYQTYIQEIKELDRKIEHDRKLRDFLTIKAMDRISKEKNSSKEDRLPEDGKKKDKEAGTTKITSHDSLAEMIEKYERAFAEIYRVTNTQDIQQVIQQFKTVEEDNFSLFNYVNELNNQTENISDDIVKIQKAIDQYMTQERGSEEERAKEMKKLEVFSLMAHLVRKLSIIAMKRPISMLNNIWKL
jgi:hypothetical protein